MKAGVSLGLNLPNRAITWGVEPEQLFRIAEMADRCEAFGSVWVGDQLLARPRLEALVTLATVAGRTSRIRLGTNCLGTLVFRDPVLLALQWSSLDLISGGRAELCVCLGGSAATGPDYRAQLELFGVRSGERVGVFEAHFKELRRLLSGEPARRNGYLSNISLPQVLRRELPIGIASGIKESPLRRVARLADAWQVSRVTPEVFQSTWASLNEYAEEYGRPGAVRAARVHLQVAVAESDEAARSEAITFLNAYQAGSGPTSEELKKSWLAVGAPETVAERITEYIDAGCTTPILRFAAADQVSQMEAFVARVVPLL